MDNGEKFVNQMVEEAKPSKRNFGKALEFLKSKGYPTDKYQKWSDVDDDWRSLIQEFGKKYPRGGIGLEESNAIWNKDYQPTSDAFETAVNYLYAKEWYADPKNVEMMKNAKGGTTYEDYLAENWED